MSQLSRRFWTIGTLALLLVAGSGAGCVPVDDDERTINTEGDATSSTSDDTGSDESMSDTSDDNTNTQDTDSTTDDDDDNGTIGGSSGGDWETVRSPAEKADINAIHFIDDKRGWMSTDGDPMVSDRGAWYTDDGGKNWEFKRQEFAAYVTRFDANGERVWMGGSDSRELWYSDDNDRFVPHDNVEPQDWIGNLYFWNKDVGILGSQTGDRIHRTTDGGESYKVFEFERDIAPGINTFEVHGDEVWAGTGPDFNDDGTGAHILHSTDRGENWEVIKLEDQAHRFKGGSIQGIHAVSSDEVWAAGVNRQLYHTTDGGDSWEQITGIPADKYGFNDIDGVGDHLVAGGNDEGGTFLYESTDGGDSWEVTYGQDSCGSGCEIEGIEFVHENLAYAYGYGNTLIRYEGN